MFLVRLVDVAAFKKENARTFEESLLLCFLFFKPFRPKFSFHLCRKEVLLGLGNNPLSRNVLLWLPFLHRFSSS